MERRESARLAVALLLTLASAGCSGRASPSHDPAPSAEGRDVAAAVASRLETLPEDPAAIITSSLVSREVDLVAAVPNGTTVRAREDSWSPIGPDNGLMEVEIIRPGSAPARYAALMMLDHGEWFLLATVEIVDE